MPMTWSREHALTELEQRGATRDPTRTYPLWSAEEGICFICPHRYAVVHGSQSPPKAECRWVGQSKRACRDPAAFVHERFFSPWVGDRDWREDVGDCER